MAIESVDMNKAQNSASYAQQVIRSGKLDSEQRSILIATWGTDKIELWESIDGTEYKIDDVGYDSAKAAGANAAAESAGYDGSKTGAGFVDAYLSVGSAAGSRIIGSIVTNKIAEKGVEKLGEGGAIQNAKSKCISDFAAVALAAGIVAKYLAQKPNQEQHEALMKIMQSELPRGDQDLRDAQKALADATEKVTELSEDAEAKNEEANDKIEKEKVLFDYNRNEYLRLANSGEKLSSEDKTNMEKSYSTMQKIGGEDGTIKTIQGDTLKEVEDIHGKIEDSLGIYDNAAETIGEVEGMTEYVEGYDENTRASCYAEAAAQGINAASAYVAAGRLFAKAPAAFWGAALYIAAGTAGTLAGAASTKFTVDQLKMAGEINGEIHARRDVQDFVGETQKVYEEDLDNYAENIEVVEDLELEIPEDLEIPEPTTVPTEGGQGGSPLGGQVPAPTNKPEENDEDEDPNKKKKDNE